MKTTALRASTSHISRKPVHYVGTIGHVDHGKSTLTSAITFFLAAKGRAVERPIDSLDKLPEEQKRGVTIRNGFCTFETEHCVYVHVDCPGHVDFVDAMVAASYQIDTAIVVVSALEGPREQTREHILHVQRAGVKNVIVFLSMMDRVEDDVIAMIAEEETLSLLDRCGFDGGNTTVVRGCARDVIRSSQVESESTCIKDLLSALDKTAQPKSWDAEGTFFMPVHQTVLLPQLGTVITGRIECGTVQPRDKLELVGGNLSAKRLVVKSIESFRRQLEKGQAGDLVGLFVRGDVDGNDTRSRVVTRPGSIHPSSFFWAEIHVLEAKLGGRWKPIRNGYEPIFHFVTGKIRGQLMLPKRHRKAQPGDSLAVRIQLARPLVIKQDWVFSARDGRRTVLFGRVLEIIN